MGVLVSFLGKKNPRFGFEKVKGSTLRFSTTIGDSHRRRRSVIYDEASLSPNDRPLKKNERKIRKEYGFFLKGVRMKLLNFFWLL